jgi:hypothetical protein
MGPWAWQNLEDGYNFVPSNCSNADNISPAMGLAPTAANSQLISASISTSNVNPVELAQAVKPCLCRALCLMPQVRHCCCGLLPLLLEHDKEGRSSRSSEA